MKANTSRRCVHLDFHMSPEIAGIGKHFSKENFQKALKAAKLESITVFAKCHNGYCYYPTQVGTMNPNLDFDLTGAWIEAAHEIGVKAPVYITAGWCALDAEQHPDWRAVRKDGSYRNVNFDLTASADCAKPDCSWLDMCLNDGPYCEHIYALTEEVCQRYKELDGLFYDICVRNDPCYCEHCKAGMRAMGLDPANEADAMAYFEIKHKAFMRKCGEIMDKYHPNASIFFNAGGAEIFKPQYHEFQSHFEMEDLPTAWGGYDKMPLRAKYFSKKGKFYLGMTGKFHLVWGEFGTYKTKEALKYEACAMAMQGAGCSVGDQCHPDASMEMQTYENIGYAFDYYEKIEPYCFDGESVAKLGLYISPTNPSNLGVANTLAEYQIDYDVIHDDNFCDFDTVILPDAVVLSEASVAKLQKYVAKGGKVVAFGDSIVKDGKFILDVGAEYVSPATHDMDYLMMEEGVETVADLPRAPMLCQLPAAILKEGDGEVLARKREPYFSRTYAHYSGHKNTPYDNDDKGTPAIVRKGNVVYCACPLPTIYKVYGSLYHKRYILQALRTVYHGDRVRVDLGSQGTMSLNHQPQHNRYCLNLLYAAPVPRGKATVIEDITPIYNIPIAFDFEQPIKRVYAPLTGEELPIEANRVVLPKLDCHEVLVFEY